MLGLIKKDLLIFRTMLLKQLGIMMVVYMVFAVIYKSAVFPVMMMIMLCAIYAASCFSVDESTGWNAFVLTLPVSTKQIVAARYCVVCGLMVISALVLAPIGGFIGELLLGEDMLELLASIFAVLLVYLLMQLVNMPIYYKFGPEKARLMTMMVYAVPFFGISMLVPWLREAGFDAPSAAMIPVLCIGAVAFIAVVAVISFSLSVKCFEDKNQG